MARTETRSSGHTYAVLEATDSYIEILRLLVHSSHDLIRVGYQQKQLSKDALDRKRRCKNCGERLNRSKKPVPNSSNKKLLAPFECGAGTALLRSPEQQSEVTSNYAVGSRIKCRHHPGRVRDKIYSCCMQHVSANGCIAAQEHEPLNYGEGDLEREWGLIETSSTSPSARTPKRSKFRAAVALDCEMGTSMSGEPELIRLTLVDYFSGDMLIDSLVQPTVPMLHYNTRYSGVSARDIRQATKNNQCIHGRSAAVSRVLRHVNADTIVIMHGGQNDLNTLRLIHHNVVDSFLLEKYYPKAPGGRSLKNLAKYRLGRDIQTGKGHCSREDAFAARDLVHHFAKDIPS